MKPKITIVIADDHNIVRHAIRSMLEKVKDFHVIGDAANGIETVQVTERLRPQILITDLMMPGINGLEVSRRIASSCPETRVLILSMYSDEAHVVEAYKNGASGYILKNALAEQLVYAIREAAQNRTYFSEPLSEAGILEYMQRSAATSFDLYEKLTTREREVLHLIAEGNTNAAIASLLKISRRTVEIHRAHLLQKLGLRTQRDIYRFAIQRGLLEG